MEKARVRSPDTPGGHPAIRAAWTLAGALLLAGAVSAFAQAAPAPFLALGGAALLLGGFVAYLGRHQRFLRVIGRADALVRSGRLGDARALLAPLMDRYPRFPPVERAAADLLYASGDPLSAAALYERAARSLRDPRIAVGLVAAYAALNKGGDARRASSLDRTATDVRLALAWSELVALGGDRARGRSLVAGLAATLGSAASPERLAMLHALEAIAAAHIGDTPAARQKLARAEDAFADLADADRAFVGYLGGVALREMGLPADARATFDIAMAAAPDTIGEALARRERSHLADAQSSDSSQPSTDSSSST